MTGTAGGPKAFNPSLQPVYPVPEVASYLGVEPPTIYSLIRNGKLRSVHVGRLIRIPQSALDDFIAGR